MTPPLPSCRVTEDNDTVTARVWRESFGQWYAELWVPNKNISPWPDTTTPGSHTPLGVAGCKRAGVTLHATRRGAVRSARRMRERYTAGRHPEHDRIQAETVA